MFNSEFHDLGDLFLHELQDLYDAEHRLLDALPQMAAAANNPQLRDAFESHLRETEGQVQRLETIFSLLSVDPKRETCNAMKGLIKEGKASIKAEGNPAITDLSLISSAQRVEHYEIAGYGTVRTMAEIAGLDEIGRLLQATLDEEGASDKKLTQIALQLYQRTA